MKNGLIVALAVVVSIAWMWNPGHPPRFDLEAGQQSFDSYSFKDEVYGDAPKGICYRVFTSYICRAANELTPSFVVGWMELAIDSRPLSEMTWDREILPAYFMAGVIALVSFLVLGFTCGPMALLIALATINFHGGICIPVIMGSFGLGVWALRNKSHWFWVAFVVAALNRETAPLLILWWLMSGRSIRTATLAAFGWIVLRGVLADVYVDNGMEMCWPMFERNLKMIQPISATSLFACLAGLVMLLRGLATLPNWMRRGFWTGIVLLGGMAILWSRPERMRVYAELLPIASIAINAGFWSLANGNKTNEQ